MWPSRFYDPAPYPWIESLKDIRWYVVFLHLWWGVLILVDIPLGSDWHGGVSWNVYTRFGGLHLWAYSMLVASVCAVVSIAKPMKLGVEIGLLIPQQIIVCLGAYGLFGHFFNFYHEFELSRVLRVAPLAMGVCGFHTLALATRFFPTRSGRRAGD